MLRIFISCITLFSISVVLAQTDTKQTNIEEHIQKKFGKFYKEMELIRANNVRVRFVDDIKGPGRAGKNGIQLNSDFFLQEKPNFPEDRLIIILLHEYGHVLDSNQRERIKKPSFENKVTAEYNAFKYSIEQAIIRAENGDKGPLQQVVKNLKIRSKSKNEKDPHIPAIKKVMQEPVWTKAESMLK